MEEGSGWQFLVNFRWPHQGFSIGYDLINATEEEPYNSVMIYLGCLTVIFDFE
mgnify:CR=1 FL=1